MNTNNLTTKDITLIAVLAAIICILGPLSIPLGPIPFSLAPIGVFLAPSVLKGCKSVISVLIYLLIGLVGLPVFSGFSGGLSKFSSPTGGYLIGYLLAVLIINILIPLFAKNLFLEYIILVIGLLALYTLGVSWLSLSASMPLAQAIKVGVLPFVVFDLIKLGIALFLGNVIRKRLNLIQG